MHNNRIRNFALIAHIDHGKSTLADRIMEICGAVGQNHQAQLLDSLELEREHGITIKLKAIRLDYSSEIISAASKAGPDISEERHRDNVARRPADIDHSRMVAPNDSSLITHHSSLVQNYVLNLIDTPGHVDFSYEVSRSLASVEGAVLIVDAAQGVQAQTLANFNLAQNAGLTIIPVINKIDLPQAEVAKTQTELTELGFLDHEILKVSAKTGEGVRQLLDEIITKIPAPLTMNDKLSALIFDSSLDPYKGVIATIRLFGGEIKVGDQISFLATGARAQVLQIGYLTPAPAYVEKLDSGEIGFITTNLKDLAKVKVGDTITIFPNPNSIPLPGYQEAKPVVFLSFYPTDPHDFPKLKEALEKLKLNDAALTFSPESSISLGQGLRLGFLGLLHAQITQERLEREYGLDIIAASPSVNFLINGQAINKPSEFDPAAKSPQEPIARVTVFAPEKYYGAISLLIHEKRGEVLNFQSIGSLQKIESKIPLLELIGGFYDQLKSLSSGYASFDFEVKDYQDAKLVRLDVLVNHEPIEGLAQIVSAQKAEITGRKLVGKLKEAIPRQQIPVPIQAVIGSRIIARETVPTYRKDVTQKLYGGDVTRKMKLLEKQKKGKKRMRRFGQVDIPQEAFLAVLKI